MCGVLKGGLRMEQERLKAYTREIRAVAIGFLALVFLVPAAASADYDLDAVWRDLDKVQMYYEKGSYNRASKLLAKVRQKVIYESPDWGMEYPENVRRQITILEILISDARGEYDSYPKFRGKIIEQQGNVGGYIVVQGAKEEKTFFYERGLIISYGKKSRKTSSQADRNRNNPFGALQYTRGLEGKRVTVYYELNNSLGPLAVKIVINE
jgi:hypothetical protein